MTFKTDCTISTPALVAKHDFGFSDDRGRALGCIVTTYEATYETLPESYRGSYFTIAPGHYFMVCVDASREGHGFGASQRAKHFSTEAAAQAYVATRIRATRARYAKRFA